MISDGCAGLLELTGDGGALAASGSSLSEFFTAAARVSFLSPLICESDGLSMMGGETLDALAVVVLHSSASWLSHLEKSCRDTHILVGIPQVVRTVGPTRPLRGVKSAR